MGKYRIRSDSRSSNFDIPEDKWESIFGKASHMKSNSGEECTSLMPEMKLEYLNKEELIKQYPKKGNGLPTIEEEAQYKKYLKFGIFLTVFFIGTICTILLF